MTDIRVVLRTIEQIRAACKELDDLRQRQAEDYRKESENLKKRKEELLEQMRTSYASYKEENLGRIRQGLEGLVELLSQDYKAEFDEAPDNKSTYLEQDEETNLAALYRLLDAINAGVAKLNEVHLDDMVPHETVTVEGEEIVVTKGDETQRFGPDTPKRNRTAPLQPLKSAAKRMLSYCKDAMACLEVLEQSYDRKFDIDGFTSFVERSNKEQLARLMIEQTDAYDQRFSTLLGTESAKAVPESFFLGLAEDGKRFDVDENTVPTAFAQAMTLGDMDMLVDSDDKHLGYFRNSPLLKKYMADGHIRAPLVLDLKTCGNILLNIDEETYADDTTAFVNQLLMQFLLSFPAKHVKFCLVDADTQMGFSPYKSLTRIDEGALMQGIIRDDRKVEDAIKDMEQILYQVDDDVLSYNNEPDVFAYNESHKDDPQDIHVFVLVNYPMGIGSNDAAKRLLRVLQNGNRTGIFCLLVNNAAVAPKDGFQEEDNKQFLTLAAKHSLVINKKGKTMSLTQPENTHFIPRKTLPISKLQGIVNNLGGK